MRAVRLDRPGHLEAVAVPEPGTPGPGEVLVRVRRVGICGTDFHAFEGRQPFFTYPRIIGHELGVEVVEVGPGVEHLRPGSRCAVMPYLECGACVACRRGCPNCCTDLRVLGVHVDGGLQERLVVPADKLFAHADLGFDQLALVETLGIGAHAVSRAGIAPGENVLVIGLGPIGLGTVQSARARGARVVALDADPTRLDFARERFGIADTLDTGADAEARLESLLGGELPTAVFDATGNPSSMNAAPSLTAPSGRVVFVGLHKETVSFSDQLFHRRELTLLASRNATATEFRNVIDALESGAIDTSPWVTHRTALGTVATDLPRFADRSSGVLKAIVELG